MENNDKPKALLDQVVIEQDAIATRRKVAGEDPDGEVWGLALSGGGIRSATFCLGVLKSLAANGLLKRFDYVSTVSGGGYAGSALGRTFQTVGKADTVEEELAKDDRLLWWWLRKNGRYLFPAGAKDTIFAVSTLVRGLLAVYVDLFVVGVLLSCLLILPHLAAMFGLNEANYEWVSWAPSAWWLLAIVLPILFLTCMWAYWFSAPDKTLRVFLVSLLIAACALIFAYLMVPSKAVLSGGANPMCVTIRSDTSLLEAIANHLACLSVGARLVLLQIAFSIPFAVIAAAVAGREGEVNLARNRLTRYLSTCITISLVIVLAALVDSLSWFLASVFRSHALVTAPIFAGLLVLGRALLQWLKDAQVSGGSVNMSKLANMAGLFMAFLFFLVCATFVQLVAFFGMGFTDAATSVLEPEVWALQALSRAVWLAIPCLFYILLTGTHIQALNKSSLHNFYRARLTRSYVSVGNPSRGFDPNPLTEANPANVAGVKRVSDVSPSDDVALSAYAPHAKGGPIHLINVCVNQTVDDRSGEFNRDRLGRNLTISSLGADMGSTRESIALKFPAGLAPTLGQWVAISGAAAAPGMGSNTSKGLAALMTLCGVRLGYWLEVASVRNEARKLEGWSHYLAKYEYLLNELTGTFPRSESPVWYLSDGGHFENTGIYALLKREAGFILAADCGADPEYRFGDLNNLVRIARIDFHAQITFLKLVKTSEEPAVPYLRGFGTLKDVASPESSSFMVLAKVKYKSGKEGYLVILKPALIHTLPLDLLAYKSTNSTFPQQTTADQFFDEAQWESYFRLGEELGRSVTGESVGKLLPNIARDFESQLGLGVRDALVEKNRGEAPGRAQFAGEVVKSSLGVGAVAGLLITFWQVMDKTRSDAAVEAQRRADALNKAVEKSIDPEGRLRVGEGTILFLRTALNKKDIEQGGVDYSVAKILLSRLAKRCPPQDPGNGSENDSEKVVCKDIDEMQRNLSGIRNDDLDPKYWSGSARPEATPVAAAPKVGATPPVAPGKSTESAPAKATVVPQVAMSGIDVALGACKRPERKVKLYPNVYAKTEANLVETEKTKPTLKALLDALDVRPLENVVETAEKNATRLPYMWSKTTLVYHNPQEQACAEALASLISSRWGVDAAARPLPPRLRAQPDTIELWIPPPQLPKR